MRQWMPAAGLETAEAGSALGRVVRRLCEPRFEAAVLQELQPLLPAASWSVYRTGSNSRPTLFMSASHGIADTTRECWWAYLSGPHLSDRSWGRIDEAATGAPALRLCHVCAHEVGGEHQARVYEVHGVVERLSIVEREGGGSIFAVNFYRHRHQRPFCDAQIATFDALAPVLLELVRKQIALTGAFTRPATSPEPPAPEAAVLSPGMLQERLRRLHAELTARELDVCVRLLQGMTQDGIASDLGLGVPTVKTYRNRAFARLGIHFCNELFALVLGTQRRHSAANPPFVRERVGPPPALPQKFR